MSESKARMAQDIIRLTNERDKAHRLAVRLLRCLVRVGEDHPGVVLSDDLAGIDESYWRAM